MKKQYLLKEVVLLAEIGTIGLMVRGALRIEVALATQILSMI